MNVNDQEEMKEKDAELHLEKNVNETEELPSEHIIMQNQTSTIRFAGFWMRFWAYLIDIIVIGSIDRIIINPIFRALDISLHEIAPIAPITVATAITFYLYFVLMTKYFGQTIGKMVFGLRVVDVNGGKLSWSTVIFREWIGRFISGAFFMLVYIVVAFHSKKQGVHDIFADTTVAHEK